MFDEVGIEQAALNDVARRAGVGPGTLWRHFANRDALVTASTRPRVVEST